MYQHAFARRETCQHLAFHLVLVGDKNLKTNHERLLMGRPNG
jgi:hypothetical protein